MGVWGEPRTKWVSERAASVTVVTGGHRVRSREPLETEERKRASGITRSPLVRSRWNSRVCLGLRRMVGVGHRRIGPRTVEKGPSVCRHHKYFEEDGSVTGKSVSSTQSGRLRGQMSRSVTGHFWDVKDERHWRNGRQRETGEMGRCGWRSRQTLVGPYAGGTRDRGRRERRVLCRWGLLNKPGKEE